MNDALQLALVSILNETANLYQQGKIFLIEQLPDVIQQLLLWKAVESFIPFAIAVIITITLVIMELKGLKYTKTKSKDSYNPNEVWFVWFICHLPYIGVIPTLYYLYNLKWLQILIAPKIYLIEYATSLLK